MFFFLILSFTVSTHTSFQISYFNYPWIWTITLRHLAFTPGDWPPRETRTLFFFPETLSSEGRWKTKLTVSPQCQSLEEVLNAITRGFWYTSHFKNKTWRGKKIDFWLDAGWNTNFPRCQGVLPHHVRVESSSCCYFLSDVTDFLFPKGVNESYCDLWHVTPAVPIGKRIWVCVLAHSVPCDAWKSFLHWERARYITIVAILIQ